MVYSDKHNYFSVIRSHLDFVSYQQSNLNIYFQSLYSLLLQFQLHIVFNKNKAISQILVYCIVYKYKPVYKYIPVILHINCIYVSHIVEYWHLERERIDTPLPIKQTNQALSHSYSFNCLKEIILFLSLVHNKPKLSLKIF